MRTVTYALSLVLIFMIPWEGALLFRDDSATAARFMGFALGGFWVATVAAEGRFRRPGPFHIALLFFVLWNAFSVFWSADVGRTLGQAMTWAQLFVFVFVLWDLYTTREAVSAGLQAFILGAYVALAGAVANFFAGNAFYTVYQRFSPGDTNPDGFGFIIALGIPVAWHLAVSAGTSKMSNFLRWVNYGYIPAACVGIALSGTRTAMIAALPGMAFGLASLTRIQLWRRVAVFLLLVSVVFVMLPYLQALPSFQRLGTTYSEVTTGDLNNRIDTWREGLANFAEHPFIGVGSNMYRSVNSFGKVAHNSFLSVLVEVGLVGFVAFTIILTIAVIQARGQPTWDSRFWLTVLVVWAIGASMLTWEHRKTTWLFLSLLTVSAALTRDREETVPLLHADRSLSSV